MTVTADGKQHHADRTLLAVAAERDDVSLMEMLLRGECGIPADVNAPTANGKTPLMLACKYGNAAAIKILLQHAANRDQTCNGGWNALDYAHAYGNHAPQSLL